MEFFEKNVLSCKLFLNIITRFNPRGIEFFIEHLLFTDFLFLYPEIDKIYIY